MISSAERRAFDGFPAEPEPPPVVSQAVVSQAHERALASYLLNRHRGAAAVREILVADIRGFLDLGLPHVAADLSVVLRLLLAKCPEARRVSRPPFAWDEATATEPPS